jgi:hypothetical protein
LLDGARRFANPTEAPRPHLPAVAKGGRIRWIRAVQIGVAGGLLVIPLAQLWLSVTTGSQDLGIDWFAYREAALGWLHGGSFYTPEQLAGPYVLLTWEPLYPPIALPLLVLIAHQPDALCGAVPGGLYLAALWRMAPQGWWLPATIGLFVLSSGIYPWWYGQPTIWLFPAIAWGLLLGGWAVFVFVKPSLFPFALIGIHRKSWWVTFAAFLAVCVPSGTLWIDWYRALDNSDQTVWYSLWQAPMMVVPVVAWLGRRRREGEPRIDPQAWIAPFRAVKRLVQHPARPG